MKLYRNLGPAKYRIRDTSEKPNCSDDQREGGIMYINQRKQHITIKTANVADNKGSKKTFEAKFGIGESPVGDAELEDVIVMVVTSPSSEVVGVGEGTDGVSVGVVDVELVTDPETGSIATEETLEGAAAVVGAELVEPNPTAITGTRDVVSEKRLVTVTVFSWFTISIITS